MSEMKLYLDDYPLEEHYLACEHYLYYDTLDWEQISRRISEEGVIFFDISNVLDLFPHLELDDDYELICYLTKEYHGIWGRIAAIKKGNPCEPVNDPEKERVSKFFLGHQLTLPEGATPPMEAIYNDGSPHGYFEAVLAEEFVGAIPYTHFQYDHWDRCIQEYPREFQTDWNIYEKITDLRPHIITTHNGSIIVSLCWRHFEDGFGASDGCDVIRLAQHTFVKSLNWYHFVNGVEKHSMYNARINDDSRFREGRQCSVATENSVTIAVQKDWRTLSESKKK